MSLESNKTLIAAVFAAVLFSATVTGQTQSHKIFSGAGASHSFEIIDGTLWAWGNNNKGQLGDGTTVQRNSRVKIGTVTDWATIAVAAEHSFGIKTDGSLWAWGRNEYGFLGDGTKEQKLSPVRVGTDNTWKSISTFDNHANAIKLDGTLWGWGFGIQGNGTETTNLIPAQIGTDNNWVAVERGRYHTLALKTDGTLWAWGENKYGQLGNGNTKERLKPVQIEKDIKWAAIAVGGETSHALDTDGKRWAWGYNSLKQLGRGFSSGNNEIPEQIGTTVKWKQIVASGSHVLGLKPDGTLWAWGYNNRGQVGIGSVVEQSSPVQIGKANDWTAIAAGAYHSLALKSDSSLWAWGDNSKGQSGIGTLVSYSRPVNKEEREQLAAQAAIDSVVAFTTKMVNEKNGYTTEPKAETKSNDVIGALTPETLRTLMGKSTNEVAKIMQENGYTFIKNENETDIYTAKGNMIAVKYAFSTVVKYVYNTLSINYFTRIASYLHGMSYLDLKEKVPGWQYAALGNYGGVLVLAKQAINANGVNQVDIVFEKR